MQIRAQSAGRSHSESKTFRKHSNARAWLKKREGALDAPEALAVAAASSETLGELIDWYIDTYRDVLRWGNKHESLRQIRGHGIADDAVAGWREARLMEYAPWRRVQGSGPATLDNALICIGEATQCFVAESTPTDFVITGPSGARFE